MTEGLHSLQMVLQELDLAAVVLLWCEHPLVKSN